MLKDNFYFIKEQTVTDNSTVNFTVSLNSLHTIYQAHFPDNPVTPGVCIIQIAKELFSFLKQKDCTVTKIKTVKFTHPIDPTLYNTIHFKMEWKDNINSFTVKVTVYEEDTVFSKINMEVKKNE